MLPDRVGHEYYLAMMQLVPAAGRIRNPIVFLDGDWLRYAFSTHDYSILQPICESGAPQQSSRTRWTSTSGQSKGRFDHPQFFLPQTHTSGQSVFEAHRKAVIRFRLQFNHVPIH